MSQTSTTAHPAAPAPAVSGCHRSSDRKPLSRWLTWLMCVACACSFTEVSFADGSTEGYDLRVVLNFTGTVKTAGTCRIQLIMQGHGNVPKAVIADGARMFNPGDDAEFVAEKMESILWEALGKFRENYRIDSGVKAERTATGEKVHFVHIRRHKPRELAYRIKAIIMSAPPDITIAMKTGIPKKEIKTSSLELPRQFAGAVDLHALQPHGSTWLTDEVAAVDFGPGISVNAFTVVSDSHIIADVAVAPDAPLGGSHVLVLGQHPYGLPGDVLLNFSALPVTIVPEHICFGDLTGDGAIDVLDLLIVLASWGPCPGCGADLNGDDIVDVLDLLIVLSNWGPCPAPIYACCLGNQCVEGLPAEECNAKGGSFVGTYVTCAEVECPEFPPSGCDGHCGGESPAGCWCDEDCYLFGDCCADVCDFCEKSFSNGCPRPSLGPCCIGPNCVDFLTQPQCRANGGAFMGNFLTCSQVTCPEIVFPTCEGNCGGLDATGSCWCDDLCVDFGDCCDDVCTWCSDDLPPKYCAPSELGACCFGAECVDEMTAKECTGMGGVFMGAGSDCQDVACADPFACPPASYEWVRQFGSDTIDTARGVAADGDNAYVVGYTWGLLPGQKPVGNVDAFIARYDANGTQIWLRQFGTAGAEEARAVAVDAAGNAYVVGRTNDSLPGHESAGGWDAFLIKYDSAGNQVWVRQFGSSAFDYAEGVAVDGAGNIYVSGSTQGTLPGQVSAGGWDAFVVKYNPAGAQLWVRQFGTSANDEARGMAADAAGNAYITGLTLGTFPGQPSGASFDAYLAAYNSSGNQLWVRQVATNGTDIAFAAAVDGAGNVYAAGSTSGTLPGQESAGGTDAFVVGYSPGGALLALTQFGTNGNDNARGITIPVNTQRLFVAGVTTGGFAGQPAGGGQDAFLAALEFDGTPIGVSQFGTAGPDTAFAVAATNAGDVCVAGETWATFPGEQSAGSIDAYITRWESCTLMVELVPFPFLTIEGDCQQGLITVIVEYAVPYEPIALYGGFEADVECAYEIPSGVCAGENLCIADAELLDTTIADENGTAVFTLKTNPELCSLQLLQAITRSANHCFRSRLIQLDPQSHGASRCEYVIDCPLTIDRGNCPVLVKNAVRDYAHRIVYGPTDCIIGGNCPLNHERFWNIDVRYKDLTGQHRRCTMRVRVTSNGACTNLGSPFETEFVNAAPASCDEWPPP